jgi:hypothetical protein
LFYVSYLFRQPFHPHRESARPLFILNNFLKLFLAALSESSCWRDKRTSHGAFHFNLPVTAATPHPSKIDRTASFHCFCLLHWFYQSCNCSQPTGTIICCTSRNSFMQVLLNFWVFVVAPKNTHLTTEVTVTGVSLLHTRPRPNLPSRLRSCGTFPGTGMSQMPSCHEETVLCSLDYQVLNTILLSN